MTHIWPPPPYPPSLFLSLSFSLSFFSTPPPFPPSPRVVALISWGFERLMYGQYIYIIFLLPPSLPPPSFWYVCGGAVQKTLSFFFLSHSSVFLKFSLLFFLFFLLLSFSSSFFPISFSSLSLLLPPSLPPLSPSIPPPSLFSNRLDEVNSWYFFF